MTGGKRELRRPLDIHWSDQARDDLAAIGDYIAADNPVAAMRWVDRLIADVERIMPETLPETPIARTSARS